MSNLQHERITALCPRAAARPRCADLDGPIAQSAAKRKDASFADFLEEELKPSARQGVPGRGRC